MPALNSGDKILDLELMLQMKGTLGNLWGK